MRALKSSFERLEFLAGIRKGLDQIERDETVPHEEVKRQLANMAGKIIWSDINEAPVCTSFFVFFDLCQ
jgi:hypothetical protein